MKRHINIRLLSGMMLAAVASASLTGCMDDIEVTQVATEEQVGGSATATESLANGIPAYTNQAMSNYLDQGWHGAIGYAGVMIARDRMTGDACIPTTGYDHYSAYATNQAMGSRYAYGSYFWQYYYGFLNSTNTLISSIDEETATEDQLGYYGMALAYRALIYLDLARCFEFLPNDMISSVNESGNDVNGLTVPIVDENTAESDARNNPRVNRDAMYQFILADLDKAEKYIGFLPSTNGKTMPDLACTYGLKARLYLWYGDYANAEKYARLAIDASGISPMTQEDCLNPTSGMNDITKWMLGSQQNSETYTVQTGICNWTSMVSNQTMYGYTGPTTQMYYLIDVNMYSRISDTDWRKLWWVAPAGSPLEGQNTYTSPMYEGQISAYGSLKFRPNEGNGDDNTISAASAYPLMRVEEMYFIEAEAAAHVDPARGKQLVENFMRTYRDPEYTCNATSTDDVVEEIVFQKRVELWGEGQTFYDIKRLNYSVTRGYQGTMFGEDARFNTNGRPAWMNLCFPNSEEENNKGVNGFNNPDPSECYTPWADPNA